MSSRKLKFVASVEISSLLQVPYLNGILYAKAKLKQGGEFSAFTDRRPVVNNTVEWNSPFEFSIKTTTDSHGVVNPCILHVSIRKETNGGKSHEKLGFVDINLAEFAGGAQSERRYLPQASGRTHRLNNSILAVTVKLRQTEGGPCFKAPNMPPAIALNDRSASADGVLKLDSAASAGGLELADVDGRAAAGGAFPVAPERHHRRRPSTISNNSGSSASSAPDGSSVGVSSSPLLSERRAVRSWASSRVDADDVVDALLGSNGLGVPSEKDGPRADRLSSLTLYVNKDGSASVARPTLRKFMGAGSTDRPLSHQEGS